MKMSLKWIYFYEKLSNYLQLILDFIFLLYFLSYLLIHSSLQVFFSRSDFASQLVTLILILSVQLDQTISKIQEKGYRLKYDDELNEHSLINFYGQLLRENLNI